MVGPVLGEMPAVWERGKMKCPCACEGRKNIGADTHNGPSAGRCQARPLKNRKPELDLKNVVAFR